MVKLWVCRPFARTITLLWTINMWEFWEKRPKGKCWKCKSLTFGERSFNTTNTRFSLKLNICRPKQSNNLNDNWFITCKINHLFSKSKQFHSNSSSGAAWESSAEEVPPPEKSNPIPRGSTFLIKTSMLPSTITHSTLTSHSSLIKVLTTAEGFSKLPKTNWKKIKFQYRECPSPNVSINRHGANSRSSVIPTPLIVTAETAKNAHRQWSKLP